MDKNLMFSIIQSLVNYIIVNTISASSNAKSENYFKAQLDQNQKQLTDMLLGMRTTILNEIKEQNDRSRELEKEIAERIEKN